MGLRVEPDFAVSIAGASRTEVLRERLTRLRLSSGTGMEADELELEFDDRDNAIELPKHGAIITLQIGYKGEALVDAGQFTVDETEVSGPPDTLSVRGKSSDMRDSLKAQKSRSFHGMSASQIVDKIAGDNGLKGEVHPSIAGVHVAHRDQTNESDLHFVTRLGRDHDATAGVKGGKLILAPKGQAASVSGKPLAAVALTRSDLTTWRATVADRDKHGSVKAAYKVNTAAAIAYVTAGGDTPPTKTLKAIHPTPEAATTAAHAEHRRGKRKSHGVELKLPGRPEVLAGAPIRISGVRDGIDGDWIAFKVEHEIDFGSGGFSTDISASVDGLAPDTGDATPDYGGDDADPAADADPDTPAQGA